MIWGLLACSGEPDTRAVLSEPWPQDPEALLPICDQQPFEELTVTCRVQAAANFGLRGADERADAVCAQIPAGTWQDQRS